MVCRHGCSLSVTTHCSHARLIAVTSATRKQINRRNRRGDASGRQQIGGTKRPQNARMPLNGCNSELTTRWLASACRCCRSCDRLASQLARKREGEGCTRPAKGGQINFDGVGSRGRSHREKATTISGISRAREVSKGGSACEFYEQASVSRIYLTECKNIRAAKDTDST